MTTKLVVYRRDAVSGLFIFSLGCVFLRAFPLRRLCNMEKGKYLRLCNFFTVRILEGDLLYRCGVF